jgi:hypothetical protein
VLAGGDGAVLSHRSAAELWGLLKPAGGLRHVTTRVAHGSRPGLRFHTSSLPADEITDRNGIPATCVSRTLFDVAPSLTRARLKHAIDTAESRRLAGGPSLPALLRRYPRRPGAAAIGRILIVGRIGSDVTREELELRFAEFVERFGLPRPEVNALLELGGRSIECDCVWRHERLVVELDSREHHMVAAAFEADRERDRLLVAAGWRAARVTWRQLHDDPRRLARDLTSALVAIS